MSTKTKRLITKVKLDGKKIHVEYIVVKSYDDAEPDEYSVSLKDRALPEFYDALNALSSHCISICEQYNVKETEVDMLGVSFSWTQGIMGATLIGKRRLKNSNGVLMLISPHKPAGTYSEGGDTSNVMGEECEEALNVLICETERYLDGEREQLSLFPVKKDEEKKPDEQIEVCMVCRIGHPLGVQDREHIEDEKCFYADIFDKKERTKVNKLVVAKKGMPGQFVCGKCYKESLL